MVQQNDITRSDGGFILSTATNLISIVYIIPGLRLWYYFGSPHQSKPSSLARGWIQTLLGANVKQHVIGDESPISCYIKVIKSWHLFHPVDAAIAGMWWHWEMPRRAETLWDVSHKIPVPLFSHGFNSSLHDSLLYMLDSGSKNSQNAWRGDVSVFVTWSVWTLTGVWQGEAGFVTELPWLTGCVCSGSTQTQTYSSHSCSCMALYPFLTGLKVLSVYLSMNYVTVDCFVQLHWEQNIQVWISPDYFHIKGIQLKGK